MPYRNTPAAPLMEPVPVISTDPPPLRICLGVGNTALVRMTPAVAPSPVMRILPPPLSMPTLPVGTAMLPRSGLYRRPSALVLRPCKSMSAPLLAM